MEETIKNKEHEIKGSLTYEGRVIQKIIGIALEKVDGLLALDGGFLSNLKDKVIKSDNKTDGVSVEIGQKEVAVDLEIIAEYQKHIPTIFEDIKKVVEDSVHQMTNLEVIEVNVKVIDIKTKEQYQKDSVSLQEKVSDVAESTAEFTNSQIKKVKTNTEKSHKEPRVV